MLLVLQTSEEEFQLVVVFIFMKYKFLFPVYRYCIIFFYVNDWLIDYSLFLQQYWIKFLKYIFKKFSFLEKMFHIFKIISYECTTRYKVTHDKSNRRSKVFQCFSVMVDGIFGFVLNILCYFWHCSFTEEEVPKSLVSCLLLLIKSCLQKGTKHNHERWWKNLYCLTCYRKSACGVPKFFIGAMHFNFGKRQITGTGSFFVCDFFTYYSTSSFFITSFNCLFSSV